MKPETVNATLDESTLDAAVGWIERRFPGNPEDSLRRAVALVYRVCRKVQALHQDGLTQSEIARRLSISRTSVRRFLAPEAVID